MVRTIDHAELRATLGDAAQNETIIVDSQDTLIVREPLTVTTSGLTLSGLNIRLEAEMDENIVEITADGVTLTSFVIDGAREHQSGDRQTNGITVTDATNVTISNGIVTDSSRHGIRVFDPSTQTSHVEGNTVSAPGGPVADVTIRDVTVRTPRRDGCSIEGPAVSSVLVDNVRTFRSSDRGSVEVKDGASDVTVSNCYAEDCAYVVAVQDHGTFGTSDVRIARNTAVDCGTLIDTQTSVRHSGVTVQENVGRSLSGVGVRGEGGIRLHRIDGLLADGNVLENVDEVGLNVSECADVSVRGNQIRGSADDGIRVTGSDRVAITGNFLKGCSGAGIRCDGTESPLSWLQIAVNNGVALDKGIILHGAVEPVQIGLNLFEGGTVGNGEDLLTNE
jgi:hypothetical protein